MEGQNKDQDRKEATQLLQKFIDMSEINQRVVIAGFQALDTDEEKFAWLKQSINGLKP